MSTLLSIFNYVFHESIQNNLDSDASFEILRVIIRQHSIQRPPYSIEIFSLQDLESVLNYAKSSFYRHFLLYELVFSSHNEAMINCHVKGETPVATPDLNESAHVDFSGNLEKNILEQPHESQVDSDLEAESEDEVKNALKAHALTLFSSFEVHLKARTDEVQSKAKLTK
jgi:hypothetical protein